MKCMRGRSTLQLFCAPLALRRVQFRRACVAHGAVVCSLRGPVTPKPDYSSVDARPLNAFFLATFLSALRAELARGRSFPAPNAPDDPSGYAGVVSVVRRLASRDGSTPGALPASSARVLRAIVPPWLRTVFTSLFATRTPAVAAAMCAHVTVFCTQWLMGPSVVGDDGTSVEIERCRYIEETGCAGVCLQSCKRATEAFFDESMALPVSVEPDFEDFSCVFRFGKVPIPAGEDPVFGEACFSACPVKGEGGVREPICDLGGEE